MTKPKKKSYVALVRENRKLAERVDAMQGYLDSLILKTGGGAITVDRIERRVWSFHQRIEILPTSFALLEHLMLHQGEVVSPDMLAPCLWSPDEVPQSETRRAATARDHVHRIRRALGPAGEIIQTIYGRGYTIPKQEAA